MLEEIGFICLLTLAGFLLVALDILFLPGSVLVLSGVAVIVYSMHLNYEKFGWGPTGLQLLVCLGVTPFLVKWGLNHISLKQELRVEDGYVSFPDRKKYMGLIAIAESDLRPSGSIFLKLEGKEEYLDCVSDGTFIEKGSTVKIMDIQGPSIVVQKH